jgi:hypothetical protein
VQSLSRTAKLEVMARIGSAGITSGLLVTRAQSLKAGGGPHLRLAAFAGAIGGLSIPSL